MSLDAQHWVVTQADKKVAKGTARLILLAIADKVTDMSVCEAYAGTTYLVSYTNAPRSCVITARRRLLAISLLEVVEGTKGPQGATVYRIPGAIGWDRKHGTYRIPDRSEIRTPGGMESGPPRSEIRTPGGMESGPQNQNTKRHQREPERARGRDANPAAGPTGSPTKNLSLIPLDWQPNEHLHAWAAAEGHLHRLGPQGLRLATTKFVNHHIATGRTFTDIGAAWQMWISRERPEPAPPPTRPDGTPLGKGAQAAAGYLALIGETLPSLRKEPPWTPQTLPASSPESP